MSGTKKLFTSFLLLGLVGCRTSKDIHTGREESYDPTQVSTIEAGDNHAPAANSAGSLAVDSLQRELAVTQGELENVRNLSQREKEALNARIENLEKENLNLKAEMEKAKGNVAPAEVEETPTKKSSPEKLWELAKRKLREGEMEEALDSLDAFRKNYPKDNKSYTALLLTAMAQYRLKNYKDAALSFNQAIDKYSKKSDIALAWYGQGASFLHMGQREDSRLFFEEVTRRYPKSAEAREARRLLKKKSKAPADLFAVFSVWTTQILR